MSRQAILRLLAAVAAATEPAKPTSWASVDVIAHRRRRRNVALTAVELSMLEQLGLVERMPDGNQGWWRLHPRLRAMLDGEPDA